MTEEEKFYVEKRLTRTGNSIALVVPANLLKWVGIENEEGTKTEDLPVVRIMPDTSSKHGRYIAFWNPAEQAREKEKSREE